MPAHPDVTDRAHAPPTDGIPAAAVTLPAVSAAALTGAGLATLLLGVLLPMVDFFIVNVALPSIHRDLHPTSPPPPLVVSPPPSPSPLLPSIPPRPPAPS